MENKIKRLEILSFNELDFPDNLKNSLKNIDNKTERCNIIEEYYKKYAILLNLDSNPNSLSNLKYENRLTNMRNQNKAMIIIRNKEKIYYANECAFGIISVDTSRLWTELEYDGTSGIQYYKLNKETNELILDNK